MMKKQMPRWKQDAWKEILKCLDFVSFETRDEFLKCCNLALETGFSEPVKGIDYAERRKWVPFFKEIQILPTQVFSMNKSDFDNKKSFLIESGICPKNEIKSFKQNNDLSDLSDLSDDEVQVLSQSLPSSQNISSSQSLQSSQASPYSSQSSQSHFDFHSSNSLLQDQNQEYYMYELREKEAEEQRKKELARKEEEEKQKQKLLLEEEQKSMKLREVILQEAKSIAPEPTDPKIAINIAVRLPNGKRISRKFDKNVRGAEVFQWIAGQDELFNGRTPLHFNLTQYSGEVLEKNQILAEQFTYSRILLAVVLLD